MSFLSLPVELVSKILTGMKIADLLNATRISRYPRAVCMSDRLIWKLAPDADMLPLPGGQTIDSVGIALLLCCAARAGSIAQALNKPTIAPMRIVELDGLYGLPPWKYCTTTWPTRCNLLPGGRTFIMGCLGGGELGLYDIHGSYALQLHCGDCKQVGAVTWESQDNGGCITLVVVWKGMDRTYNLLSVHRLTYNPASNHPPVLTLVFKTQIPDLEGAVELSMRNSLVLVWDRPRNSNEVLLIDIVSRARIRARTSAQGSGLRVVHASLHPHLPVIVAVVSPLIEAFEFPCTLEFIEFDLLPVTSEDTWNTSIPKRRVIADLGIFDAVRNRFRLWNIYYDAEEILLDEFHRGAKDIAISTRRVSIETTDPVSLDVVTTQYHGGYTTHARRMINHADPGPMSLVFRRNEEPDCPWNIVQTSRTVCSLRVLEIPSEFIEHAVAFDAGKTLVAYC
ncbi:hypothetical protein C8R46DRAFT_1228664 [Mycena filopes]|nr:hypothetical protein C8R46DRAFT_1228664 [Mycena filopes]